MRSARRSTSACSPAAAAATASFAWRASCPCLDGPAFFAALPLRVRARTAFLPAARGARAGRARDGGGVERAQARRNDTAVIADLHGDWRAPTRLYGSRLRGALNPVADRVALAALRNADGIRTVTGYTTRPRPGARPRAGGRVSRVHGLRLLPAGGADEPLPERSGGALRRRARALQERRRPRGGLASRSTPGAAGAAAARRLRDDAAAGGGARARASGADELDRAAHAERGVVGARRVDAARPSVPLRRNGPRDRRSLLPWPPARCQPRRRHPGSRGGRSSTGCWSSRETRRRSRPRSFGCSPTVRWRSASVRARRRAPGIWTISPEEFASRLRALVERTAGLS